jgi:hypothetical protein
MKNSLINSKLGYYVCNGIQFRSKIEALIYSQVMKKPVEWVFHNEIFSAYNWTNEPNESLDELYDKRAREIREQYDYVLINYSGGSDSHNLLQSFIRQKLHVDEIVTNHISKAAEAYTTLDPNIKECWNVAAEHYLQAIPRLKEIRNILPKTKITEMDMTDVLLDNIRNSNDGDWIQTRKDPLGFATAYRFNYSYINEMLKTFDKNLSIAIVVGVEKPRIYINKDNELVVFINDAAVNLTGNDDSISHPNVSIELFYWGETTAPIICKQAHVVKKWLEEVPARQNYWRGFDQKRYRLFHETWLKNLIYSTWNKEWFQVSKPTKAWNNEWDAWFHIGMKDTREYELWKRGVDYVAKNAGDYVIIKDGLPDTFKPISQEFIIGKMKEKQ